MSGEALPHIIYACEPVPYAWIDTAGGTVISTSGEDAVVTIGFPFQFYGLVHDKLSVDSFESVLFFDRGDAVIWNAPLPAPDRARNRIAVY